MKFIRYILIIFVAYLAISLTSARIIISYADKSENYLENYLIKNNILDAEIKKINGDWRGLFPSIEVLLDNNTVRKKNKIYPNKIKVDINIYKSIFLLKPVIREIYLENIYYKSNLDSIIIFIKSKKFTNSIIIENIKIGKSNFVIEHNKNIFNLKNANILIKDSHVNISAKIDDDKKIQANIKNIKIKNSELSSFDYKLKIDGIFNYNFKNILNDYNLEIKNSDLKILASGFYKNNKLINNKFSILTNNKSSILLGNKAINNININFILNSNIDKYIEFEINKLNFISRNNNFYDFENIAVIYNIEKKYISTFSKSLDINLDRLFKDYDFTLKDNMYFSGSIKNFNLSFNLLNIYNDFYLSGFFSNSTLSSNKGYLRNFSGFIESSDNSTFIRFNSQNTDLSFKSIFRSDYSFSFINGEIGIFNYSEPVINISDLNFINDEIDITTTGVINNSKDIIKVFTKINKVDMTKVTSYMPLSLMSDKSSKWFTKSFTKGYANEAYIVIDGNISNYPFYDNSMGLSYAEFPISKLNVDYKKGWLPFEDITGVAYFDKRSVYFKANEFNVLDTSAINTSLEILDVKDIELIIKGKLIGPFNDLLKYSNTASLTEVKNSKIIKIKGNSETDLKIKIAFNGSENDYQSTIRLDNINYIMDGKNKFTNVSGKILYKNNIFYTDKNEFINANYNNKNVSFSLATDNDKNFVVSGSKKIDVSSYIENISYKNRILGPSLWNYKLKIPGFNNISKKIKIYANSELYKTSVNFPKPFKKEKNIKKNISVNAFLENNNFSDISIKYNGIYAEISSFDNLTGYINFSGNKLTAPNNKLNITGKIDIFNLNDWKKISKNNVDIDYLSYVNKIDLTINKLINKNIIFDNFSVKGLCSNKSFIFSEILVSSNNVNIVSSGEVEFNNITSFKINLNSKNLENLLNYWKFSHSLRNSSIASNFNISWQGSLFDYNLDKIYGNFSTVMKEGRLKKVGNRATRIFGLFNIDLLAKRLSLDFDDVTKNGFYFNSLNGDFRIDSGNIFTTNLVIKGPSAEMLAVGTTDIVNETYDMQVVASPEFGEALPAIALLGGPITAAATFAAEKLAKAFGKDINNLIKIKYKVSGTWDEPIIKIMGKDENAFENVEDLFK